MKPPIHKNPSNQTPASPHPNLTQPGSNPGFSGPSPTSQSSSQFSPTNTQQSKDTTQATIIVPVNPEQEKQLLLFCSSAQTSLISQYNVRSEMEEIDRVYMREKDWTSDQIKAKLQNRRGDSNMMQNVTVPIVMPQVNAALSYMVEVFLSGYPMFPVTSDPSNEDAAEQLETIIGENAITAGWAQQLMQFFRDGLKYNLHAVEVEWQQKTSWTVDSDPNMPNGAKGKKVLWNGNTVKRMDLYNTFWDVRTHPSEVHSKGEFAGYTELYSKIAFYQYLASLPQMPSQELIDKCLHSGSVQGGIGTSTSAPFSYYQPIVNPFPFMQRESGFDWMSWATATPDTGRLAGANQTGIYGITKMYARIIPAMFGFRVPDAMMPQVWKFVFVNGKVCLSAERLTNIHQFIPILFGQPIEDGLDYQTKSFADNVKDMQAVASAMWNSVIASKRRLIGDRVLYDPSRIRQSDINSTNPAAKIPVRPSAFGKAINEAVYQFPYRDEQVDALGQTSAAVISFANTINGQNPATQGQFVKGNKTRHEYDDVMGHGNGQNQMMAMATEAQVFTPMKEILKLNVLQYQSGGQVYNRDKGKTVNVNPVDLRQSAVHFKVSDGLIPSDKVTGDDMLQTVVQQLGSSPQLAGGFNLPPMFTYLMKTQGLDLTPFEKSQEQMMYEQQLQAWTQAAQMAAKAGQEFKTPQPQPSQQLQQEMQQKGQAGVGPSIVTAALESTQGS